MNADTRLTRADVERIVREARERGVRIDLSGLDLRWAILADATLADAILVDADLTGAHLSGADLTGADLSGADLTGADLRGADLPGADLTGADLRGAILRGAKGVISFGTTPSGVARMIPLPGGFWWLTIGCWSGTTYDLRTLIDGDDWPEAQGDEQDRRRPILAALADLADAQATYRHDWLEAVVERWGDTTKETA